MDAIYLPDKLKKRGVAPSMSYQRYFDSATHMFLAKILIEDGQTRLTEPQMIRELSL